MALPFDASDAQDDVRKAALLKLTAQLVQQGHPPEYAQHMATASIFQTDLDLRNAQLSSLLAWLQDAYPDLYPAAADLLDRVRQDFERRLTGDF